MNLSYPKLYIRYNIPIRNKSTNFHLSISVTRHVIMKQITFLIPTWKFFSLIGLIDNMWCNKHSHSQRIFIDPVTYLNNVKAFPVDPAIGTSRSLVNTITYDLTVYCGKIEGV